MFNLINRLCHWIDQRAQGVPMKDVYAEAKQRATYAQRMAQHTVFRHRYIQHMAEAKLAALEQWKKDNPTDEPK